MKIGGHYEIKSPLLCYKTKSDILKTLTGLIPSLLPENEKNNAILPVRFHIKHRLTCKAQGRHSKDVAVKLYYKLNVHSNNASFP